VGFKKEAIPPILRRIGGIAVLLCLAAALYATFILVG